MQKVTLRARIRINNIANHGIIHIQDLECAASIVLIPVWVRHIRVSGGVRVEVDEEGDEVVAHDCGNCAVIAGGCSRVSDEFQQGEISN